MKELKSKLIIRVARGAVPAAPRGSAKRQQQNALGWENICLQ